MDTIAMTAVYPHDAAYARAHGELAAYRNARRRNIACKDAIEEAIAKHFDGMHLDEACVKEVLDQYGRAGNAGAGGNGAGKSLGWTLLQCEQALGTRKGDSSRA